MKPKIAIPVPHSQKQDYAQRSLPQYLRAIENSGGEPVVIQLTQTPTEIAKSISQCQAVLLPGSAADVDPEKYSAARHPKTAPADSLRDAADELLLQDAYNLHKPILGICYGLQSLNVWRTGTLVQDIAEQVESKAKNRVNHEAGREVARAHQVRVDPDSRFAALLAENAEGNGGKERNADWEIPVNSSHHQSAEQIGDGLRVVARCPQDGVIEALEGTAADHFVVAVQWHPERTYDSEPESRALFRAFIKAAEQHRLR
ncbi:MAG: gamma-glutamyl-gamma-aminobutyrate hydrolase family protein [Acidobacteriales bacterium]|nr:gamma-glutamyl-gamma-aminobutyrate hydrolase family protein [Terriglobales bacterium]